MTYLVVGVDQSTFAPWHQNVGAADVATAKQIAFARAQARGHPARDRRRDRAELTVLADPRRAARGPAATPPDAPDSGLTARAGDGRAHDHDARSRGLAPPPHSLARAAADRRVRAA